MFIPDLQEILRRSDVASTAESFRSWDTCMANKTCKIVAIIGICILVFIALWFIFAIFSCLCMGKQVIEACCCCCRSANTVYVEKPVQHPYNNPNMYPRTPAPYMYEQPAPAPAHFANQYNGYQPVRGDVTDENPFSDNNGYHNRKREYN